MYTDPRDPFCPTRKNPMQELFASSRAYCKDEVIKAAEKKEKDKQKVKDQKKKKKQEKGIRAVNRARLGVTIRKKDKGEKEAK